MQAIPILSPPESSTNPRTPSEYPQGAWFWWQQEVECLWKMYGPWVVDNYFYQRDPWDRRIWRLFERDSTPSRAMKVSAAVMDDFGMLVKVKP